MRSDVYYQCKLTRENTTTVTWVPAKLAKVGKRVTLDELPEIWTVEEAYLDTPTTKDVLDQGHRARRDTESCLK